MINFVLIFFLFFVSKSMAQVRIAQLAPCAKIDSEWVVIHNFNTSSQDIRKWRFRENNINHFLTPVDFDGILPAESSAVIVDIVEKFREIFPQNTLPIIDSSWGTLNNAGESIALLNEKKEMIDEISYPACELKTYFERMNHVFISRNISDWNQVVSSPKVQDDPIPDTAPSPSNQSIIRLSEVFPRGKVDFIELWVGDKSESYLNLEGLHIIYNGRKIWEQSVPWIVPTNVWITIYFDKNFLTQESPLSQVSHKKSLSHSAATISVRHARESDFIEYDALCWHTKPQTTTAKKRIEKLQWSGSCLKVKQWEVGTSLARKNIAVDTDSYEDFFWHYHGSPGGENITRNHRPRAKIIIQGNKRHFGVVPFSVNFDGRNSTDPDGKKDISHVYWSKNREIFSYKINPLSLRITRTGIHEIELLVADRLGFIDTASIEILAFESKEKLENYLSPQAETAQIFRKNLLGDIRQDRFFTPFLQWVQEN